MHFFSPSLSLQNPTFSAPILPQFSTRNVLLPKTISVGKKAFSVKCRRSDYHGAPGPTEGGSSFAPQFQGAQAAKVFVGHSIYKGKAALTVEPRTPEFTPLDSGAYKVSKEGFILLQFAPAVATRQYDWNRKQLFSLSVPEIGMLMNLGAKDSCEFFHDPFKGKSEEGKIRKLLKAEPLPDGSGHFLNLSVHNRLLNVDENVYIPITRAEFTVLNSLFNFIIPYLLGWHIFANTIKPEDAVCLNNAARSSSELEWGK